MKKEQFFRLIGELDDRFLEEYRQIDLRLSHKAYRKKRTLRILAVAACLALLIGVCVPVGMMIAQLGNGPSNPLPSITLQSLAELETMREMIECEDEQVLNDYLHSITGGGAQSRQDLIDFVGLVDNTPYAKFMDGEITGLTYNQTDKRFSVSTEAENGESMYVSYELGMSDVEKNMEKAAGKLGRKNLLSAPLSTEDGRLTLYTETREPRSDGGDVIRWQGILDGIAVYIVYWVADADTVDTAALLDSLEIAASVVPQFPKYAWANTEFGAFVENPEYERYCGVYESYSIPEPWVWVNREGYDDPEAPLSYFANDLFSAEIGSLNYEGTWPQTLEGQAVHIYEIVENGASYTAYMDAETGAFIGWEVGGKVQTPIATSEQEMMDLVYAYLASYVRDPHAYTSQVTKEEGYTICSYVRYVGGMQTCDALTAYFDSEGALDSILLGYLGAFRHLEEVPDKLIDTVRADLTELGQQYADTTEIKLKGLHIAPDGRVALDCSLIRPEVEYQYLAYLTEPVNAENDTAPDVTEPVETKPVTTELVTTEPVTTEPVVTEPPTETHHMIRLGSLAELDLMRDMILCEDEQELSQYLSSLNAMGQNVQSKQDLIDFVDLVDSTPFAKILDGEIIGLRIVMSPNSKYHTKNLFVEVKGENGDSISYTYQWSDISVSEHIQSALKTAGTNNLLQAPVQSADGRLTIYTEMREKLILGSKYRIQWWGELDGVFMEITYNVVKPEDVITSEVIGSLEMTSIVAQP